MSRHARRRYWVGRSQRRLLVFNIGYYVVCLGVFSAALWAPLVFGMLSQDASPGERQETAELLLYLHRRLVPIMLGMMVLFALHSVFVAHRIAGPLVRFCRTFQSIGKGDLTVRLRLRDKDYLHEEAADLQAMIDALRERLGRLQASSAELGAQWRRHAADLDAEGDPERLARRRAIEERVRELEHEWSAFSLGSTDAARWPCADGAEPAAALPTPAEADRAPTEPCRGAVGRGRD